MADHRSNRLSTGGGQRALMAYVLAVVTVLLVSFAGYAGYLLYPRFDLPGVSVLGLFVLAAGAGVACFFSPCSFPLLVSLLGRTPTGNDAQPSWQRTLPFAIGMSIGATGFLLLVGSVIGLVGSATFAGVVFTSTEGIVLRFVVGTVLICLGLVQLRVLTIPLPPAQDLADPFIGTVEYQAAPGIRRAAIFGFGYLLAGFG